MLVVICAKYGMTSPRALSNRGGGGTTTVVDRKTDRVNPIYTPNLTIDFTKRSELIAQYDTLCHHRVNNHKDNGEYDL